MFKLVGADCYRLVFTGAEPSSFNADSGDEMKPLSGLCITCGENPLVLFFAAIGNNSFMMSNANKHLQSPLSNFYSISDLDGIDPSIFLADWNMSRIGFDLLG